ncbi:MAG: 6-bladed beta-propeller [Desulfuromonadaceae bacterium]|nr:6-bladed beta-propeller [Desulfuromonadaceae bacterium]MDD2854504.1 6-bladed beta-propeller [Desulfuromonadaceae bacterium]
MLENISYFIRFIHGKSGIIFYAAVLCMFVAGCSTARLNEAAWQDKNLTAVWPPPPEEGRIKILKVIQGAKDVLGASSGLTKKIFDYVTGNKEEYIDFYTPQCIAADGNGLIYVADPSVGLVHRYSMADKSVDYIFQAGEKRLLNPVGVALDNDNNLYISDSQIAAIFKFAPNGDFISQLDSSAKLQRPAGIGIRSNGDLLVADPVANKVFIFGRDDKFKGELAGGDFSESFNRPTYLTVDKQDNVYVTDTMNFTVRVFDSNNRYIRSQGQLGDVPGSFARPKGVALDGDGNLYVIDSVFGNFQIFDQKGQLLLYVGQEGSYPGEFMLPSGIFIDRNDRIYISDTFNHRIQIYQYLKKKVN